MHSHCNLRQYIKSISNLVLPIPHSQVTHDFVAHVVNAHSWHNSVSRSEPKTVSFNFFVAPGPLLEVFGGIRDLHQFQYLKYGVPETIFSAGRELPREIYDAGLVVVQQDYKSEMSQQLMRDGIANMLNIIAVYKRQFSL